MLVVASLRDRDRPDGSIDVVERVAGTPGC